MGKYWTKSFSDLLHQPCRNMTAWVLFFCSKMLLLLRHFFCEDHDQSIIIFEVHLNQKTSVTYFTFSWIWKVKFWSSILGFIRVYHHNLVHSLDVFNSLVLIVRIGLLDNNGQISKMNSYRLRFCYPP